MKVDIRKLGVLIAYVHNQERSLAPFMLSGWGLILFILLYFAGLFFYSTNTVIFAHPDFLTLVLIPPMLTWRAWSAIDKANGSAQVAILLVTIRIWIVLLIMDRLVVTLSLAPYDYVDYMFWLRIAALLALQVFIFGLMGKWRYFHKRPHFFFLVIFFPAVLIFHVIEYSNALVLGLSVTGLLLAASFLIGTPPQDQMVGSDA